MEIPLSHTSDTREIRISKVMQKTGTNYNTYLQVCLDGKWQMCHLDTGCEHSIIPRKLIPTAALLPTLVQATAANGTEISILGRATVEFQVQGSSLTAEVLVTEDVEEFILGHDWLLSRDAT